MARANHDIEHDSAEGDGDDRGRRDRWLFSGGEDPMDLGFPLVRFGGWRVRVHWVTVVFAVCELAGAAADGKLRFVSACLGMLLVLVLLREAARALVARSMGSRARTLILWPLGGLNSLSSPEMARPALAECGGLLLGAVLAPVLGVGAHAAGAPWRDLWFNPFAPGDVLPGPASPWPAMRLVLWSAYYMNWVLLALNALVPMYPMDLGRVVAASLRRRRPGTGTERMARVGFVTSVVLLIGAAVTVEALMIGLAVVGFIATWVESRRGPLLLASGDSGSVEEEDWATVGADDPPARRHRGKVEAAGGDAELDRVLAKISREGLSSLSTGERDLLARETERRRRG